MFESPSIHCIWDTPQHFLRTYFCIESGFLSFLELQKCLLVSFQRCWTQWQMFESSSIHCIWDNPQHFHRTHFSWESGFLSFFEPPEMPTRQFSGVLNTMANVWKVKHSLYLRYPKTFFQNTFLLRSDLISLLELQKSLLLGYQGCWPQWQRFENSSNHYF